MRYFRLFGELRGYYVCGRWLGVILVWCRIVINFFVLLAVMVFRLRCVSRLDCVVVWLGLVGCFTCCLRMAVDVASVLLPVLLDLVGFRLV